MNKKILARFGAAICLGGVVGLSSVACQSSHSDSAASAKANSTAAATAADAQLAHDGYTPTHLPGFGKVDLGIGNGKYRYEAVYTYTGKDVKLMQDAVQNAADKLKSDPGVALKMDFSPPDNYLIVTQAATVSDLKAAAKAVAASVK